LGIRRADRLALDPLLEVLFLDADPVADSKGPQVATPDCPVDDLAVEAAHLGNFVRGVELSCHRHSI